MTGQRIEKGREAHPQQGEELDVVVDLVLGHQRQVVLQLRDVSIDGSRRAQETEEAVDQTAETTVVLSIARGRAGQLGDTSVETLELLVRKQRRHGASR